MVNNMNKNKKAGTMAQRVGGLIEIEICKRLDLTQNKRQRTFPFYDAFDKNGIYEIKAGSSDYKRFILIISNHKQLSDAEGSYIFVEYTKNIMDKKLTLVDELNLINVKTVKASDIDILTAKPLRTNCDGVVRISFKDVGL